MNCRENAGGTFQVTLQLVRTDYTAPLESALREQFRCEAAPQHRSGGAGGPRKRALPALGPESLRGAGRSGRGACTVKAQDAQILVWRTLLVDDRATRIRQRPRDDLPDDPSP